MKLRVLSTLGVLAAAATAASAQSTFNLYGVVDSGVEHLTNVGAGGATAAGNSQRPASWSASATSSDQEATA